MSTLRPQTALLLALQAGLLALLLERPLNLALLLAAAGVFWLSGANRGRWWLMVALLAVGTWSVMLSQGLFYAAEPRTAVARLLPPAWFPLGEPPGLYLYREGLWHGLVQSMRFSVVLLLGAGLLARYATDALTAGLRGLRVPAPLCFLFSMALRFVPLLLAEGRAAWNAQHFRGYRLRRLFSRLHGPWGGVGALALPLLAAQVRKSDEVAAALVSRGFFPAAGVPEPPPPAPARERALCLAGGGAVLLLAVSIVLTRLHAGGVWSHDGLAWLYDWVVTHV